MITGQISMFNEKENTITVNIAAHGEIELNISEIISLKIFFDIFGELKYQIEFFKAFFIDGRYEKLKTIGNINYLAFSSLISRKGEFDFEVVNEMEETEYRKNISPEFGFIRTTYNKAYLVPFSKIERVFEKEKTDFRSGKNYKKSNMIFIEGDFLGRGKEVVRISEVEYKMLQKRGILNTLDTGEKSAERIIL